MVMHYELLFRCGAVFLVHLRDTVSKRENFSFAVENVLILVDLSYDIVLQDEASALWIAAQMGHSQVARCLLQAGAEVDAVREVT